MKSTANRFVIGVAFIIAIGAVTPVSADYTAGMDAFKAKDYGTAAEAFEAVIDAQPNEPATHYMLGLCRRAQKNLSAALGSFRKAMELDSANETPNPMYSITLGQTLNQAKQYGEAYSTLKALDFTKLPGNYRTTYALLFAKAANETDRAGEAVNVLNAQVRADTSNADLYQALGVAQDDLGDDKEAFSAFKRAYELDGDQISGRYAVRSATAVARRSTSSTEKNRYYTDAANISEALARAKPTLEHNLLTGESWLGAKQYSKALSWFEKAKAQSPQNALIQYYIGQSYTSLGQLSNALSSLQRALDLGSGNPDLRKKIYNQMGYVHEKNRDFMKAKQAYSEAGNRSKAAAMDQKEEAEAGNIIHEKECREFKNKIDALAMQAEEFEKLGDIESARQMREQLTVLQRQYAETCR